ncbi:glycosyltransferase family 4 protein [Burkholderia contaminans]|uniref:glycosyltransferase family 4 protein n=1 Tax=Burkholderia contaminans TaxID=488447 RepID=UPI001CC1CFF6|nr:glycosyltransferase family 1 protein [Burkholderia contaminans]
MLDFGQLVCSPLSRAERQPYLFTVAGEVPSKNVDRLLQAFALARPTLSEDLKLCIAGIKTPHHKYFLQRAAALGLGGHVELLGYVSRQELTMYYRQARAFIFASLFEGFGIPLLEAMASGTPVACSNTTSMPEIVGGCGLHFDPFSVGDMAEQIRKICSGAAAVDVMVRGGISRARTFSESTVSPLIQDFWSVCREHSQEKAVGPDTQISLPGDRRRQVAGLSPLQGIVPPLLADAVELV